MIHLLSEKKESNFSKPTEMTNGKSTFLAADLIKATSSYSSDFITFFERIFPSNSKLKK